MPLRRLLLGFLLVVTAGFAAFALAHMFPPAPYGLADDWRVFYAAAQLIAQGGNPYNSATMHVAEQAAQHYASVQPSLDDFTDLPVVGLVLRAFTWLPYWWSYAVFTAIGMAVAGLAMWAWVRELGWSRVGVWLAAALLSWPLLLGVFAGQFDLLMLGGLVASLILMRRNAPWLAGLCMAVVLLKPHILWPLPLLLGAAWVADPPRLKRFAVSAAAVLVGGAVAGFALVPDAADFFPHVLSFDSRVTSGQPDLSGLPGLFAHLPQGALIGDVIALAGALGVIGLAVLAVRDPRLRSLAAQQRSVIPLAGLALWLACTPYAHPNDDVLLLPLLAMAIGERGRNLDERWLQLGIIGSLALIFAFISAPALAPRSWSPRWWRWQPCATGSPPAPSPPSRWPRSSFFPTSGPCTWLRSRRLRWRCRWSLWPGCSSSERGCSSSWACVTFGTACAPAPWRLGRWFSPVPGRRNLDGPVTAITRPLQADENAAPSA